MPNAILKKRNDDADFWQAHRWRSLCKIAKGRPDGVELWYSKQDKQYKIAVGTTVISGDSFEKCLEAFTGS